MAFVGRRDELRTRYNYQHALNEDTKSVLEWFTTVQRVIDENGTVYNRRVSTTSMRLD